MFKNIFLKYFPTRIICASLISPHPSIACPTHEPCNSFGCRSSQV